MIKNERQYTITKAQAARLESALAQLDRASAHEADLHPLLRKAQHDALSSQIEDLRAQLREYEALRSGVRSVIEVASFDELPYALIQARIAVGLSQKELADRLGLKEQQIQRYEATDYASASLERVREIVQALGITVREEVFLPSIKVSPSSLFQRLGKSGLDRKFVLDKLLPRQLAARLEAGGAGEGGDSAALALQAASIVGRVYGWAVSQIFGDTVLQPSLAPAAVARFKLSTVANEQRTSAYTVYAHYLALILLEATAALPQRPVPTEWQEVRREVLTRYGAISFTNTLRYVWGLGIPVLPLNDSGAFHGACWRVGRRNIVVLKQRTQADGRWLFDLLHELRHAGQDPELEEFAVIEANEMSPERRESADEFAASEFAGDVILDGRAEELTAQCVQAANGSVERLKSAVTRVAQQESVPIDGLANYLAFRLSRQNLDWWGAAQNLQRTDTHPWQTARDICLEQLDMSMVNESDRSLLLQALSDAGN